MTEDQAAAIFRRLIAAFPSYDEWLSTIHEKQVNDGLAFQDLTINVWKRMLSSVEYSAALEVCEKMLDGSLAFPKPYERDQLAIWIKSYSERVIQDRNKILRDRKIAEMSAERANRPRGCKAMNRKHSAVELFSECQSIWNRYRAGTITEEERDDLLALNQSKISEPMTV